MAGPAFSTSFKGLDEFLAKLERRPREVLQATKAAIFVDGEQLMAAAKRLTPVDEGVLRASGHVRLPEETPDSVTVEVGFGGPAGAGENDKDVGYAVIVHEDLTAHHTVGQAKYLEVPFNRRKAGFAERIARRIKRRLGVV